MGLDAITTVKKIRDVRKGDLLIYDKRFIAEIKCRNFDKKNSVVLKETLSIPVDSSYIKEEPLESGGIMSTVIDQNTNILPSKLEFLGFLGKDFELPDSVYSEPRKRTIRVIDKENADKVEEVKKRIYGKEKLGTFEDNTIKEETFKQAFITNKLFNKSFSNQNVYLIKPASLLRKGYIFEREDADDFTKNPDTFTKARKDTIYIVTEANGEKVKFKELDCIKDCKIIQENKVNARTNEDRYVNVLGYKEMGATQELSCNITKIPLLKTPKKQKHLINREKGIDNLQKSDICKKGSINWNKDNICCKLRKEQD